MKLAGLLSMALAGLALDLGCSASSSPSPVADSGTTEPDAPTDDASSGDGGPGGPAPDGDTGAPGPAACPVTATKHRAAPVTCAATNALDGGAACTTSADCGDAGASVGGPKPTCLQGRCGLDQCTTDADCPNGGVCSCMGDTRGYAGASPSNVCVAANCRTDADCGAGGSCSPAFSTAGPFYGVQGYDCHTCADACTNDSDCTDSGVACFGGPYCAYDSAVAHWVCGTSCAAG